MSSTDWSMLLFLLLVVAVITLIITLFYVVVEMSNKRGRETWFWFVFGIITTPLASMILLYLLGETDEEHRSRIMKEEQWKVVYKNKEIR